MGDLRAENERLKQSETQAAQKDSELTLSDEEIRQKIAQADKTPTDFAFQRNLGMALYRYGAMKQDVNLISEAGRLLQRTYDNNPKDYDVIVALGNVKYDIGYFKKDFESFKKAREFYLKALEQKPNDADVRTDYGLTFYLAEPPEMDKAVAEFEKSLQANPKHTRALQFITQALLKQNKKPEAEKYLARLKEINPNTPDLANFETRMLEEEKAVQNQ